MRRSVRAGLVAAITVAACSPPEVRGRRAPPVVARPPSASPEPHCPGDPEAESAAWTLSTTTFDPRFTAQAFVGNGYLGERVPAAGMGYVSTGEKTGWPLYTPRFAGSFVAGLYARDPLIRKNREIIAAVPTWSSLLVNVGAETYGPAIDPSRVTNFRQTLYLRCGLLRTSLTWTTSDGHDATDLVYDVMVSRTNNHTAAVRLQLRPHTSGVITVTDLVDGAGARRLVPSGEPLSAADGTVGVVFRTAGTNVTGAIASTLRHANDVRPTSAWNGAPDGLSATRSLRFPAEAGQSYELVKYVGVDTERTAREPTKAAVAASRAAASAGWSRLLADHAAAWRDLWSGDVVVGRPDLQTWLRSGMYSLLASAGAGHYASMAPAGLGSDDYAGLVFWDAETWIFPALLSSRPELARSILEYRYQTMADARANAAKLGYRGTLYPWTSATSGRLESECHAGSHCVEQIHLQSDIALAVWQYYLATGDVPWLAQRGWPLLRGIAEFWASRATRNADGTYSIAPVAGPDEYSNGVRDGVFTNAAAATTLRHATHAARIVSEQPPPAWAEIADKLRIPFEDRRQIYLQYDGFAGNKIKQADTVLLIYPLEWPMPNAVARNTLEDYTRLTDPDGPAMTDSIHAIDAAAIGEPGCALYTYLMRAIRPFVRGPFAQFAEARGAKAGAEDAAGAPAFSFHTGAGGFAQVFLYGLSGLRWREDRVHLDPILPPQLEDGVTLTGLRWRGRTFDVAIGAERATVSLRAGEALTVESPRGVGVVRVGSPLVLPTRRPDRLPTPNAARCVPAHASSEEPGRYAEAAVDGNDATSWRPDAADGSLTIDLRRSVEITQVAVRWSDASPPWFEVSVSPDAVRWTVAGLADESGRLAVPAAARFVRIDLKAEGATSRVGIREVEVR